MEQFPSVANIRQSDRSKVLRWLACQVSVCSAHADRTVL